MDSSSSQEQQHQNLQYHLSIQTKQQQIRDTKLEQLSLPKLSTTDSLLVCDIACLFHSFPQQIDSSFHRDHNNNNTKLTLPLIHHSIQTKQQQIFDNENLVGISIPVLRTTTSFEVRDIPCLFHSFPQQIDSSFHRYHNNNNNNNKLTVPPIHHSIQTKQQQIYNNDNLVGISIPVLETSSSFFRVRNQHSKYIHRHNNTKLTYHPPSLFPLTTPIPPPTLQVFANSNLQTLCAPNLVDGGSVCIGDDINQPSLDADLSSLVTGSFAGFSPCYGRTDPFTNQLNATTVCGVEPNGLFTTEGCQN